MVKTKIPDEDQIQSDLQFENQILILLQIIIIIESEICMFLGKFFLFCRVLVLKE